MVCTACGHRVGQWMGRCPSCAAWGSIEQAAGGSGPPAVELLAAGEEPGSRLSTGFVGADRVLGGGLVCGSVVLVAGEPGIGKSTLLLQVAGRLSSGGRSCLYASGEESSAQVASRAGRVGLPAGTVSFVPGRELPVVVEAARAARPDVLIVDSIQAIRDPEQASLPGGPTQVRVCADALISVAKGDGIVVVLAGQVTKEGDVAGPRTLEHAVDVVCSFDGDARTGLRVLAGGKNRFGPEGEAAWFEMSADGLREVEAAAALAHTEGDPGSAAAILIAGRRALAVEIQALTVPTDGPPRRHVSGLDPRRFAQVAAVVDRATGHRLARAELYGAAAGGLRVLEPGADLAVAAALVSAASGVPAPAGTAFVGEVSLTGAVRPAANLSIRLAAAAAAGMKTVVCAGEAPAPGGVTVKRVRHVRDALAWARKPEGRRAGGPRTPAGTKNAV